MARSLVTVCVHCGAENPGRARAAGRPWYCSQQCYDITHRDLARGGYIARGTGTHPLPLSTGYLIPASSVSRLTKGGRPEDPEGV